jgi:hypothetical protein
VGTGAVNRAIILRDVEIEGPRAKGVRHGRVGGPELIVAAAFIEQRGLGRVALGETVE